MLHPFSNFNFSFRTPLEHPCILNYPKISFSRKQHMQPSVYSLNSLGFHFLIKLMLFSTFHKFGRGHKQGVHEAASETHFLKGYGTPIFMIENNFSCITGIKSNKAECLLG